MTILAADRPLTISSREIQQYRDDGAICLRGVIDDHWLDILREATERALAGTIMDMSKKGQTGKFIGDINVWGKDPGFRDFALDGPSWQIARTLMGARAVRLFSDQLFVKEPGASTASPWHQDQTYWPVVGDHVCSVWVTMDPVTRESSGLEYIRGSHRWGRRFDPEDFGEMSLDMLRDPANEKIPDIDADRDRYEFLSWDMAPGDCLVHHALAVHGAGGNKSTTQRRRAISTRWFGEQAYFRPHGPFTAEMTGLQPGDPMTGPMFPLVPGDKAAVVTWGERP